MTLHAFTLIIVAGIIHAFWNIVAKKAGGDARFSLFTSVLNAVVWLPVGWWVGKDVVPLWGATEWAFVSASALLHIFYFITLLRGYRVADLTVVYPLARGSGPLISSMVAVLFLGEHLSSLGALGIAAVVAGVFLIAGGPAMLRAATRPGPGEARERTLKGLYYGLLTGLFIAAYTVVDSYAVKVVMLSPILLDYMGNLVRVVMLAPLGVMNWAETQRLWRLQWRFALVVAIFSPMAYVLVLYAVQTAPISHVAPAREVSMLFAALIGGKLLGEGDRLLRIAGALLIGVGVVALGLG
ncbi:drug/metabolite transporter (DMT)-like permease [Comamonas sp. BIGb0152]|uniref:DMT family transporter n=1 Tax=Comamonas sp. BIGb0152 TaxID=2940601 RepID=UPI0021698075|nr:DMT family transporter [Comamonas sp. BIGb0152]MCS4292240.1 drug/metabolite transporter (DMT)-like permease [Comamonas sp. BIGb0152]